MGLVMMDHSALFDLQPVSARSPYSVSFSLFLISSLPRNTRAKRTFAVSYRLMESHRDSCLGWSFKRWRHDHRRRADGGRSFGSRPAKATDNGFGSGLYMYIYIVGEGVQRAGLGSGRAISKFVCAGMPRASVKYRCILILFSVRVLLFLHCPCDNLACER